MSPAIIIYILALSPLMEEMRLRAVEAFRDVVQVDYEDFNRLVAEASQVDARAEMLAFGAGAAFGFLANGPWGIQGDYPWLKFYLPFSSVLMYGLLGWIIFMSLASTRLQSTLHRQPMQIDVFDLKAFEPTGRHSLFSSLAFVGGSVISLLLINPLAVGLNAMTLGLYGVLAAVAILVFFLGLWPTHRVLARAKAQELYDVRGQIAATFRELNARKAEGGDVGPLWAEVNLWLKYEERLKVARTWPYNTAMLRTLFLSVLLPAIASGIQRFVLSVVLR